MDPPQPNHNPKSNAPTKTIITTLRKTVLDLLAMGLDSQEKLRLAESFAPTLEQQRQKVERDLDALKSDHDLEMGKLKGQLGNEQLEKNFLKKKLEHEAERFSKAEAEMKRDIQKLSDLNSSATRKMSQLLQSQRQSAEVDHEKEKLHRELDKLRLELAQAQQKPAESEVLKERLSKTDVEMHPVFGELVGEMPDRKIYLTPIANLSRIEVWEQQRAFQKKRATRMAADLAKARREDEYPRPFAGSLVLCDSSDDFSGQDSSKVCIVDGQHRVGALTILLEANGFGDNPPPVLTEVHRRRHKKDIRQLFVEINKAEPVLEIDLPDLDTAEQDGSEPKASLKEILRTPITQAVEELQFRYPDFFKQSRRCQRPHFHADMLRDDLLSALLEERMKFDKPFEELTPGDLIVALEAINAEYSTKDDSEWLNLLGKEEKGRKVLGKTLERAIKKSREHGFYLGLYNAWLG